MSGSLVAGIGKSDGNFGRLLKYFNADTAACTWPLFSLIKVNTNHKMLT